MTDATIADGFILLGVFSAFMAALWIGGVIVERFYEM